MGIDISERAIGFARLMVPGCRFIVGSVDQAELGRDAFDAATPIEVFEHIDPLAAPAFLEGIHARLRDSGVLLVTVPSSNVPVSPKHYRHFHEASLRVALSPPFHVDEVLFLNRIAHWHGLLYRLMSNQLFILAHPRLLAWLLRTYERSSLRASPRDCSRLLAVCRKD
jgi:SAM-dependent methyltransferase